MAQAPAPLSWHHRLRRNQSSHLKKAAPSCESYFTVQSRPNRWPRQPRRENFCELLPSFVLDPCPAAARNATPPKVSAALLPQFLPTAPLKCETTKNMPHPPHRAASLNKPHAPARRIHCTLRQRYPLAACLQKSQWIFRLRRTGIPAPLSSFHASPQTPSLSHSHRDKPLPVEFHGR